jgi:hypothetical protein
MQAKTGMGVFIAALCTLGAAKVSASQINPHAFCAAHRNNPGPGDQSRRDIPRAVKDAGGSYWRCSNGNVMICNGGATGFGCARGQRVDADRKRAFIGFCIQNSGSDYIPEALTVGLHAEWRCNGTTPMEVHKNKLDTKGYAVGNWRPL